MQSAVEVLDDRTTASAEPVVKRRLWWIVHSWVGLKLSLFMVWVLLTGTFAVFSSEMDWLARPAMRVQPQVGPRASLGAIVEAAAAAVPGARVTTVYLPAHSWFAAEVWVEIGQEIRRVYVNPYDGQVQGTGSWMSFQRFLREMHRHLLLPARYGIPLVCSLSLLLVVSIITGLVTYKKFWRGFFRLPRPGNARRFNGDLHRFGGLWSLWFTIVITLTGVWYLVETLGGNAPITQPPRVTQAGRPLDGARIDELVAIGQRAYPNLRITELRMPEAGRGLAVLGQGDAILVRDRTNAVWLDPATGTVADVWKGEQLSVHQRISEMADPLHFGTWGGMTTKVIWFLFGAVMTGLSVTGIIIFSVRLKKAYIDERTLQPSGNWLRRAWDGMGSWAYVGAGIVLLSLALIPGWLVK